jgi:alpha-galactosidase/6-phospho-beta-glucosidase family protein
VRALASNPLVISLTRAEQLLKDIYPLQKAYFPAHFQI